MIRQAPLQINVNSLDDVVDIIRDLIRAGRTDPKVRQLALSIINQVPEFDAYNEARMIHEWLCQNFTYRRDVFHVETLHDAPTLLEQKLGDCDDFAILGGSLYNAVGLECRLILVSADLTENFTHVYLEVNLGGIWIASDPSMKMSLGQEHLNLTARKVVSI